VVDREYSELKTDLLEAKEFAKHREAQEAEALRNAPPPSTPASSGEEGSAKAMKAPAVKKATAVKKQAAPGPTEAVAAGAAKKTGASEAPAAASSSASHVSSVTSSPTIASSATASRYCLVQVFVCMCTGPWAV